MRLSRIFVGQALDPGAQIHLESDAYHYLKKVLRLKSGAAIVLFNGQDLYEYESLLSFQGKQAIATIQNAVAANTESILSTEIIQGLSRSDHMDWMIQKCTELGVTRISVFNANHTQIPLKPAQREKRLGHWRNIAIKACEQCGRQIPPLVNFQQGIVAALAEPVQRDMKILLDSEGDRLRFGSVSRDTDDSIAILVGPEGGLSDTETKSAKNADFVATRIGPRVLRTETAAATALAIVQFSYGDI